jgi:anhydro-N-acetylmuramic acid kinase
MEQQIIVGLMSGTSMDGVDAAVVCLTAGNGGPPAYSVETLACFHRPYLVEERQGLQALIEYGTLERFVQWDAYLGEVFAETALIVIRQAGLQPSEVTVIGSHGQTVWHAPNATLFGKRAGGTLQIGQPDVIAARTGIPTVADFRTRDVAHGGQGAPLVPFADWLMLRDETESRVALNIGGMANLTVLPAGKPPDEIWAFDTGPGNALIDLAARWETNGEQWFDEGGLLAKQGQVDTAALQTFLRHPYFQITPPKSTGREVFGDEFFQQHREILMWNGSPVATFTELTVLTIADALQRWVMPRVDIRRVIVSGGGVHNQTLLERLWDLLPGLVLESSANDGIDPDFKEAIAFALLAGAYLRGLPASFPGTTGASKPVVLGKLCVPG